MSKYKNQIIILIMIIIITKRIVIKASNNNKNEYLPSSSHNKLIMSFKKHSYNSANNGDRRYEDESWIA